MLWGSALELNSVSNVVDSVDPGVLGRLVKAKIIVVFAMAMFWALPATAVDTGGTAPSWQATKFDGQSVSFPKFVRGKPTVIIFWATWCSYCKAFMPDLKALQQEYGADSIEIIAVNTREEEGGDSDPDAYIKNIGFPLTAIRKGDDIAAAYGVKGMPGLMVVGGDGTVTYRRAMTRLPAGKTVAELWDTQVRAALDKEFKDGC